MNLLLAAQTGYGKSFTSQGVVETNLSEYERVIILDYKDEYTGLVETYDAVKRFIVGPNEHAKAPGWWLALIEANEALQLPRHQLNADQWREVCGHIVSAARAYSESILVVIDEAHFVAPQDQGYPTSIKGLATTGRGEGASSIFITQRLQELRQTIISQCTAKLLGGFSDDRDLKKIGRAIDYPVDVHRPGGIPVPGLPESLHAPDEGAISVRKFTDDQEHVVGSEWIYSDDSGSRDRRDTREMNPTAPHYGAQGKQIKWPDG